MASAQVLRKQEHLEAGKRKLEEFRKKKAAERAKKATSDSQPHALEGVRQEKRPPEAAHVRLGDSDGARTSIVADGAISELPEAAVEKDFDGAVLAQKNDLSSEIISASSAFFPKNYDTHSSLPAWSHSTDKDFGGDNVSESTKPVSIYYNSWQEIKRDETPLRVADGVATDQYAASSRSSAKASDEISSQSSYHALNELSSNNRSGVFKDLALMNADDSMHDAISITSSSLKVKPNVGTLEYNNSVYPEWSESKFNGASSYVNNVNSSSPWSSDTGYTGLVSAERNSYDLSQVSPPISGINGRRSRPSFLDSLNVPRATSLSHSLPGPGKAHTISPSVPPVEEPSVYENVVNSSVASSNGIGLDNKHDSYSQKHNEDFAALEQHIEDLTQEKFSLQRALESSRALAESLAAENSTLTDSYNKQGSVVNQLRADMEMLREEIKALLAELESLKMEYGNAQLECNAADERAKLLASEVIGLEEKALRLRSNELKLERQLENSQSEITSFKKRISSLEKERQDLQSTIEALQEEKKLLQSKLRKAAASGKLIYSSKSATNKKDISTSTEDLAEYSEAEAIADASNLENHSTGSSGSGASGILFGHENEQFNQGQSLAIPPDQIRMIQNINVLMSELASEKEELMKALSEESSLCSNLKELNKELTRKLEVQTQRLELLTAQSMVNPNIPARQPDLRPVHENAVYADEGDEVVERVLGWIMRLFPGGPSRRRTNKLI